VYLCVVCARTTI